MNLRRISPMKYNAEARKELSHLRQVLRRLSDEDQRHRKYLKQLLEVYHGGDPKPLITYLESL